MKDADRSKLHAAAVMLGALGLDGAPSPARMLDSHDWQRLLRVKDLSGSVKFDCPQWVPWNLWNLNSAGGGVSGFVNNLVFSPGAEEFWNLVETVYDRPNSIAISLPLELERIQQLWNSTEKRPPAAYREHMLSLKAKALALAREVDLLDSQSELTTGERFDVLQLVPENERKEAAQRVHVHNLRLRSTALLEEKGAPLGWKKGEVTATFDLNDWNEYVQPEDPTKPSSPDNWSLASSEAVTVWQAFFGDNDGWEGIVPPVAEILRRLANYFEASASSPPLQRPLFQNAERNFFVSNLCIYFRDSFGFVSPALTSRLICILFPQGISENEVSQALRRIPGGNAPRPEDS